MLSYIHLPIRFPLLLILVALSISCEKEVFQTERLDATNNESEASVVEQKVDYPEDDRIVSTRSENCKSFSAVHITNVLNGVLSQFTIRLDRDDTHLKYRGRTVYQTTIPTTKINKKAWDWKYYVKDINSESIRVTQDRNRFILSIAFEGEGSEIKGKSNCRLCDNDRRAPDLQWKSPRKVEVYLRPIPYNNSISLDVLDVKILGKFEFNGFLDDTLLRFLFNDYEKKMDDEIRKGLLIALRDTHIRNEIANQVRPLLQWFGIDQARSVFLFDDKIQFCREELYLGFRNRYRRNDYLFVGGGNLPYTYPLGQWWKIGARFHWALEPVLGTPYYRLKNRHTGLYLHNENGRLENGAISYGWWSAMWELVPIPGQSHYQIRNRWKPNQYLHTEYGYLQLGGIRPGWWSAMWSVEPLED